MPCAVIYLDNTQSVVNCYVYKKMSNICEDKLKTKDVLN